MWGLMWGLRFIGGGSAPEVVEPLGVALEQVLHLQAAAAFIGFLLRVCRRKDLAGIDFPSIFLCLLVEVEDGRRLVFALDGPGLRLGTNSQYLFLFVVLHHLNTRQHTVSWRSQDALHQRYINARLRRVIHNHIAQTCHSVIPWHPNHAGQGVPTGQDHSLLRQGR